MRTSQKKPVLTTGLTTSLAAFKSTMLNANITIVKKSVKRKKHPQFVNILKKVIKATTIIKRILDLGVSFIILISY